ncbi:MAG: hypothetical protein PHU44_17875 [Syntrophales bacterium]|nr:hypothetical protein [Syntrophales bacterium]MDD5643293.1 hypothetical protein [Syntrophales bacterium]
MDIMQIRGRRVHLSNLHTRDGYGNGPITLGCGVYREVHGREERTGESIRGEIPTEELIRWGLRKGYLKFVQLREEET